VSDIHFIPDEVTPIPRRGLRLTTLMVGVLIVGGLVGLSIRAVYQSRESARENQCRLNLKQIALALENYRSAYGCFPPAYLADATGKPMHSWRMLIIPYMEKSPFYSSYKFDEPWDGPNNRKLLDPYWPPYYDCPSRGAKRGLTSYVMIVGPKTAFPGVHTIKLGDIRDGAGRTIVIAEVSNVDIHWTEPRDLDAESMSWIINDPSKPGLSSLHDRGPAVLFADGTIRRLGTFQPSATLKAMTSIDGGEAIDLDKLH
jgi:type II secretory pathway pseudopilin PulG